MPKRKTTTRRITTIDGLVYALKQKVGDSADLQVGQYTYCFSKPGRTTVSTWWSCDCKVTDRDGYELEVSVSSADTPNILITKLMTALAKAAHEARQKPALKDRTSSERSNQFAQANRQSKKTTAARLQRKMKILRDNREHY